MLSLFDLHCDMPTEAYGKKLSLGSSALMASAAKASELDTYIQVAAIWSDCRLKDEEAFLRYCEVRDFFASQIREKGHVFVRREADVIPHKNNYILAVEDARLLSGDLSRLEILYRDGVRFLTLVWAGESIIGGAFDTDAPLTAFGRRVTEECFRLGIVPDLSHASDVMIDEVLTMAEARGMPVVATHSNSRSVFRHPRNLTDEAFCRIAALGGIVGISLAPQHLTDGDCDPHVVLAHIRHYLEIGGENTLCLGCDFDGIEATPRTMEDLATMPRFAEFLRKNGIGSDTVEHLFYQNAAAFFARSAR